MKFPSPMAKKQAVDELRVFLRTMCVAQRRWTREIATCEMNVRKRMMEEDQCRERLRRVVLRGAYEQLKHLSTSTDLLRASQQGLTQHVSPEQLLVYGIRPEQVTCFSVYVMSRLLANPNKVGEMVVSGAPAPHPFFSGLIADFQAGWAMLSPSSKQQYQILANDLRQRLLIQQPSASTTNKNNNINNRLRRRKALVQGSSAVYQGEEEQLFAQFFPSSASVHAPSTLTSSKPEPVKRVPNSIIGKKRPSKGVAPCSQKAPMSSTPSRSNASGISAEADPSSQLSWERVAFGEFLQSTFAQMRHSLQSHVIPKRSKESLNIKKWLPIALKEWDTMSEGQKKLYCRDL